MTIMAKYPFCNRLVIVNHFKYGYVSVLSINYSLKKLLKISSIRYNKAVNVVIYFDHIQTYELSDLSFFFH